MIPIIQHIADALSQISSVNAVILFGSRARGDHWERSDIDLAVICPEATRKDWHSMIDIVDNARTLYKIDLVRFEDAQEPFKKVILSEGIPLYEREQSRPVHA